MLIHQAFVYTISRRFTYRAPPERIRAVLSGNVEQATPRDLVSALDEIDFEFKHVQIYLQPCYSGSLACREIKLPYFLVEMDFYLFNTVQCFQ